MPTTRAARRAAAERVLFELPTDVLGLVLYQLTLAHDIAAVAPTCHALDDAAKLARKLRPYSGEVVTLGGTVFAPISSVAAMADGRIITGESDGAYGTFRIYEGSLCVHSMAIYSDIWGFAMLDGARFICCGGYGGGARLWNLDGTLERSLEDVHVNCVAMLPDGAHFVIGLDADVENIRPAIKLYHVSGTLIHSFQLTTFSVYTVVVTPDGHHIVSGGDDKSVKVWNVATKSLVSTCAGHDQAVWSVAVMPDGQRILSGSCEVHDDTAPGSFQTAWILMHRLDGTLVRRFGHHTSTAMALVPLPDNTHVLSAGHDEGDNKVKLFNANDGAILRTFTHPTAAVRCLALLPDGLRFVCGDEDNTTSIIYHGLAPH